MYDVVLLLSSTTVIGRMQRVLYAYSRSSMHIHTISLSLQYLLVELVTASVRS